MTDMIGYKLDKLFECPFRLQTNLTPQEICQRLQERAAGDAFWAGPSANYTVDEASHDSFKLTWYGYKFLRIKTEVKMTASAQTTFLTGRNVWPLDMAIQHVGVAIFFAGFALANLLQTNGDGTQIIFPIFCSAVLMAVALGLWFDRNFQFKQRRNYLMKHLDATLC